MTRLSLSTFGLAAASCGLALMLGCADSAPPSVSDVSIGVDTELISRVDSILDRGTADAGDRTFLESLSDRQIEDVIGYYREHPRGAADDTNTADDLVSRDELLGYTVEEIECGWGFGGWIAWGWMHTSLCGGDSDDHFYLYRQVPNGYADRSRLRVRTINPAIWLAFSYYGMSLDARVYTNGDVFTCVGSLMHYLGITHDMWRTDVGLYKS